MFSNWFSGSKVKTINESLGDIILDKVYFTSSDHLSKYLLKYSGQKCIVHFYRYNEELRIHINSNAEDSRKHYRCQIKLAKDFMFSITDVSISFSDFDLPFFDLK